MCTNPRFLQDLNGIHARFPHLVLREPGQLDSIAPGHLSWDAGSIAYMAPECLKGKASFPSDIYSVSMTALHMATGKKPWDHLQCPGGYQFNDAQLVFHIGQPGNVHPIPEGLPDWLSDLISQCLQPASTRPSCEAVIRILCSVSIPRGSSRFSSTTSAHPQQHTDPATPFSAPSSPVRRSPVSPRTAPDPEMLRKSHLQQQQQQQQLQLTSPSSQPSGAQRRVPKPARPGSIGRIQVRVTRVLVIPCYSIVSPLLS